MCGVGAWLPNIKHGDYRLNGPEPVLDPLIAKR